MTGMHDLPLIITAAISGGVHGREANPHLPMTPSEIAASIREAHAAGAAIAHVHVWDEQGRPSPDPAYYREVYEQLDCDIVINLTTGPGGTPTEDERLLALSLRPELASFDAGSLNFGDDVFVNRMPFLRRLAAEMREAGTRPELDKLDQAVDRMACLVVRSSTSDWLLWMDLWVYARWHPETAAVQRRFHRRWRQTIADVIRYGQSTGEFKQFDADEAAQRLAALTDGLAVHMVLGDPDHTRERYVAMSLAAVALELDCDLALLRAASEDCPLPAELP